MKHIFQRFSKESPDRRMPTFRRSKDRPKVEAPIVDHESVSETDPYAFAIAHRRLAWMFRISAGMNIGLFAVVIVLVATIAELVPLKTTELALVTIDPASYRLKHVNPAEQVRITPITKNIQGYDLMFEAFVRRYTQLILEIDTVSQTDRMQKAAMFSDAKFWKDFGNKHFPEIEKAIASGLDRAITIETAELISERKGIRRYAIEFTQTDRREGSTIETENLRAYIAVTARPQTVHPIERYQNPEGFRVLDISLKPRGNK